jgi:hypothetical protein
MAFRANEAIETARREAMGKLLGRTIASERLEESRAVLSDLITLHGPVVETYPTWHPLVADNDNHQSPVTLPSHQCGYKGMDHTIFLRHGFITCPYDSADAILESVEELQQRDATKGVATITAEKLDVQLYHPGAVPVFVQCKWSIHELNRDGSIPSSLAVPLMLERELRAWRHSQVAETMASYILGRPCGSRSSLFVNEETGQTLKNIYNTIINTGMFGDVRVGTW